MRAEAVRFRFVPWRWPQRGRRALVMVAAAATLVVLGRLVFPKLEGPNVTRIAVAVTPNPLLQAAAVRAAAQPAVHGGLFRIDLEAVRARVEALPWVARADVRRVWPHTITVSVTLEKPVARWGGDALVDATGHVFSPPEAPRFTNLPQLAGPPGAAAELLADFDRAGALLAPAGLHVAELSENARGELRVALAGGLSVELGRNDPMGLLVRFVRVAVPALGADLARASAVDMRYPNGFAVAWKQHPEGELNGQKD